MPYNVHLDFNHLSNLSITGAPVLSLKSIDKVLTFKLKVNLETKQEIIE